MLQGKEGSLVSKRSGFVWALSSSTAHLRGTESGPGLNNRVCLIMCERERKKKMSHTPNIIRICKSWTPQKRLKTGSRRPTGLPYINKPPKATSAELGNCAGSITLMSLAEYVRGIH